MSEQGTLYKQDGTAISADELAEEYCFDWDIVRGTLVHFGVEVPGTITAIVEALQHYIYPHELEERGIGILHQVSTTAPLGSEVVSIFENDKEWQDFVDVILINLGLPEVEKEQLEKGVLTNAEIAEIMCNKRNSFLNLTLLIPPEKDSIEKRKFLSTGVRAFA